MVTIPFLYFCFLSFIFYRKAHQINLAVYIALIYAISGFFSIFIDIFHLRGVDIINYKISLIPVIVYCFSITLFLLPIHKYSKTYAMRIVPVEDDRVLRSIAKIVFLYSLFYFVMSFNSLRYSLTSDIGQLRSDLYSGNAEVGWVGNLPTIIRYPVALMNHFVGSPWVFQLLAFFSLYVQRMPKKYGYMFLTTSLIGPLAGVIGVDRSNTTYWILSIIGCYFMFRPYIDKKARKGAIFYGLFLLAGFISYLWLVTSSRFSNSLIYDDSQSSIIDYLGKPFINFCFFYDNFTSPITYFGMIFPFISNTILGNFADTVAWQANVTAISNISIGTFYTFLGAIKIALGKIGMYSYILIVTSMGYHLIKPKFPYYISLHKSFIYFLLASIPMLGLFGHYYSGSTKTFCVVVFFNLLYFISLRSKR